MTNQETQNSTEKRIFYQPIKEIKFFFFGIGDIAANKRMINIVKKIEEYEKARKITTRYYYYPRDLRLSHNQLFYINGPAPELIKEYSSSGKEIKPIISGIKMKSEECFVKGEIGYSNIRFQYLYAEFIFNSNDPKDKEEYLGLAKIIKEM